MKTTIGVYDNHEMALNAVVNLKNAGYPVTHVSIMGLTETEDIDEELRLTPHSPIKVAGLATGTIIGTTIGVLTGVGIFAIPGVGFLFGAGAVVGAIAGFDFGLIGGGLASVIATLGVQEDMAQKYHNDLVAGKFLLIIQGNREDAEEAKAILAEHKAHSALHTHSNVLEGVVEQLDNEFPLSGAETEF